MKILITILLSLFLIGCGNQPPPLTPQQVDMPKQVVAKDPDMSKQLKICGYIVNWSDGSFISIKSTDEKQRVQIFYLGDDDFPKHSQAGDYICVYYFLKSIYKGRHNDSITGYSPERYKYKFYTKQLQNTIADIFTEIFE